MMPYKVGIGTACGNKKEEGLLPAYRLYKSSRIRGLFNARGELPMYILSAKYGLIDAEAELRRYEHVMDDQRAHELAPQVAEAMQGYNWFAFFKGGARPAYSLCMRLASDISRIPLAIVGFGNMGDFRQFIQIANELSESGKIYTSSRSLELYNPKRLTTAL
jgi:hypothetical protein